MVKEHNKLKALGIVAIVILALVGAPALYVQEGHAFDAGTEAGKVPGGKPPGVHPFFQVFATI